ncbi:unnamed protein product [Somion occarium]|uniref:Uncharacterized protein n=1 Tax=Somion occarium TaxID=3059160 RepID=A0ABP1DG80_9APHY
MRLHVQYIFNDGLLIDTAIEYLADWSKTPALFNPAHSCIILVYGSYSLGTIDVAALHIKLTRCFLDSSHGLLFTTKAYFFHSFELFRGSIRSGAHRNPESPLTTSVSFIRMAHFTRTAGFFAAATRFPCCAARTSSTNDTNTKSPQIPSADIHVFITPIFSNCPVTFVAPIVIYRSRRLVSVDDSNRQIFPRPKF